VTVVRPLAAGRDLRAAGRPQLLGTAQLSASAAEVTAAFEMTGDRPPDLLALPENAAGRRRTLLRLAAGNAPAYGPSRAAAAYAERKLAAGDDPLSS